MRCAVVAHAAMRRGHAVAFALRGEAAARAALGREVPAAVVHPWNAPEEVVRETDALVIDSPDPIGPVLAAARRSGVPAVVLDRLDHLDDSAATVLPVAHGPAVGHARLSQGAEWCLIADAVRERTGAPYPGRRRCALLTLGGADPLGLTTPLAGALADAVAQAPGSVDEIHGVVGPAFAAAERVAGELAALGLRVHRSPGRAEMARLMAESLVAVAGFGTSVYDLAAVGTPVVYWTHRSADVDSARRLEARGIGAFGGDGAAFSPETARAALVRAVGDAGWRQAVSARGRAALAGADGAARLVGLLETLVPTGVPA
jgi:hypothetical protein